MAEKKEKKPLSETAARACEEARHPSCKCRCGGSKHGTKRGGGQYGKQGDGSYFDTPREFFEALPEDDPHYVPSEAVKAERRKAKAEQKRKEHLETLERRWAKIAEMEARGASRGIFW